MTTKAVITFIVWTLIIASLQDVAANDVRVVPGGGFYINLQVTDRPSRYIGDAIILLKRPGQADVAVFNATRNGCSIIGGLVGRVDICDRNYLYRIVFPSATANYSGQYYPMALELPQLNIKPLNVIVLVPVTYVAVSPTTSLSVVAGRQVTLTCNVNSDAALPITFTWQCYQASILLGLPSNSVNTTLPNGISNTLQWTATKQDNGGYCVCKASNEISSLQNSILPITVYYPADNVTLTASATTVAQGTSISITCESQGGNPPPGLVLYREPGHQQVLAFNPPGPLNYVITLQRFDNGANFTCETKAELAELIIPATVSNVITMNVQYPVDVEITISPSGDIVEGNHVILTCATSGGNPTNNLIYTWTYNNNVLSQAKGSTLEYITIGRDQGGQYQCTVVNAGGSATINKTIDVKYPVDVQITISPSGDVVEGDHVILKCATSGGNPTNNLMYTWSYNNNVLSQANGSTLEYIKIGRDQGGQYRCTVVNAGGSATINKTIDVKSPSGVKAYDLRVPLGSGFYINIQVTNTTSRYIGDAVMWLKRPGQADVAVFNADRNGCSIIGGLVGVVQVCDRNNLYRIVFPSVTADYSGVYYPVALELPQLNIQPLNVIVVAPSVVAANVVRVVLGESFYINLELTNTTSRYIGDAVIWLKRPGQADVAVFNATRNGCSIIGGFVGIVEVCDRNNRYKIVFPSVTADYGGQYYPVALELPQLNIQPLNVIVVDPPVVAANVIRVVIGDGFYINLELTNTTSRYIGDAVIWLKRPGQADVAVFNASGNVCSIIGGFVGIVEVCDRNNAYKIVFPSVTADYSGMYYSVTPELPQLNIRPLNVIVVDKPPTNESQP